MVRTGRHTVLIDACIGNDKERPTRPQFHRMRSGFIGDLARIGVKPEEIDYVMCTHLHWDHVGWNTRLQDGKWVPTFPNAKYVMAKREYDHWQDFHASGADSAHVLAFEDSILPVVKTGQALLVGDDYALDDGLWFESYPGHTPGNVVIHARARAAIAACSSATCCTTRCNASGRKWSTMACTPIPTPSCVSRTRLIEEHADSEQPDPAGGAFPRS